MSRSCYEQIRIRPPRNISTNRNGSAVNMYVLKLSATAIATVSAGLITELGGNTSWKGRGEMIQTDLKKRLWYGTVHRSVLCPQKSSLNILFSSKPNGKRKSPETLYYGAIFRHMTIFRRISFIPCNFLFFTETDFSLFCQ